LRQGTFSCHAFQKCSQQCNEAGNAHYLATIPQIVANWVRDMAHYFATTLNFVLSDV
jgi:hypothetical protein